MNWKQGHRIKEYVDDFGKYRMDFECPECKKWNQVIRHERIEGLTFKCQDEECQYEANASINAPTNGGLH